MNNLPRYTQLLTALKALLADDQQGYLQVYTLSNRMVRTRKAESILKIWQNLPLAVSYTPMSDARAFYKAVLGTYKTYVDYMDDWQLAIAHMKKARDAANRLKNRRSDLR